MVHQILSILVEKVNYLVKFQPSFFCQSISIINRNNEAIDLKMLDWKP